MSHNHCSPQEAASSAVKWNAVLAIGEAAAAAYFLNIGFLSETFHNAADSLSFLAKRRAMDTEKSKSINFRKIGAGIFIFGSLAGIGGAAARLVENGNEDASAAAIIVATAAAAANTRVAFRAHSAEHLDHDHIVEGAHGDSKTHAMADAVTGWAYVGGLAAEHVFPIAGDITVMGMGAFSVGAAGIIV